MRFWVAGFLIFSYCSLFGQKFTARTDAPQLLENSTFTITYTLEGGDGGSLQLPNVDPSLEIISGPSTSTQMSIINGVRSQKVSYSYTYLASKRGIFTIPPATIKHEGGILKSNPLKIEVLPRKNNNQVNTSGEKAFVKLEVSDTAAVLGQQITLDYRLYTQQDVNGFDLLNEPEYEGFYAKDIRNFRTNAQRVIIDGEEYYTQVLKRVVLFPQRTGNFRIPKVSVILAIPIPGQRRRSFFSSVPTRQNRTLTNEVNLIVKELPDGAPQSFSGAVGKYSFQAAINKNNISTDDAFVIQMEIQGNGDGKMIKAPIQPNISSMEYFDPNIIRDEDNTNGGIITNYKQIEYLLVPKKPGNYQIRPEFSYYDPDSNEYITLYAKTFNVKVTQGSGQITSDNRDIAVGEDFSLEQLPERNIHSFWLNYFDWWLYTALLLLLLVIGFISYKEYIRFKEDQLSPLEKKKRVARERALKTLKESKGYLNQNNTRKFYESLSKTLNQFLGNKYAIPNSDLNRQKISEHLSRQNIDTNWITSYNEILKSCEMALFAGSIDNQPEQVFEKALKLIEEAP